MIKVYSGNLREAKHKLLKELFLFDILRRYNIGTPKVVFKDTEGELIGRPFLVKQWIYGESADKIIERSYYSLLCIKLISKTLVKVHKVPLDVIDKSLFKIPKNIHERIISELMLIKVLSKRLKLRLDSVLSWLKDNIPRSKRLVLLHGDYNLDNILIDKRLKLYLVDLESAKVGDPMDDLSYSYIFLKFKERQSRKLRGIAPKFLLEYGSCLPIDYDMLEYYRLFNATKLMVFLIYLRKYLVKKYLILYPLLDTLFLRPMINYLKEIIKSYIPGIEVL